MKVKDLAKYLNSISNQDAEILIHLPPTETWTDFYFPLKENDILQTGHAFVFISASGGSDVPPEAKTKILIPRGKPHG